MRRSGVGREGVRRTIDERETSDNLSLPQELFLLTKRTFSSESRRPVLGREPQACVRRARGKLQGLLTVSRSPLRSPKSRVKEPQGKQDKTSRRRINRKNKKRKRNKVCGTNQARVDQAVFNQEENSVSKTMVSDDSKRPHAFCNEDGKDLEERHPAFSYREKGHEGTLDTPNKDLKD